MSQEPNACVRLGRSLRRLSEALVNREVSLAQRAPHVIGALNELGFFVDGLDPDFQLVNAEHAHDVAPIVVTHKVRGHEPVFLTTNARPQTIGACLRYALDTGQKGTATVVFLGLQDPSMARGSRGRSDAPKNRPWERLARDYVQAVDLLSHAIRLATHDQINGSNRIDNAAKLFFDVGETEDRDADNPAPTSFSLLVGNGLNRLSNPSLSWTRTLVRIACDHLSGDALLSTLMVVLAPTVPSPQKFEYLSGEVGAAITQQGSGSGASSLARNPFEVLKRDLATVMQGKHPNQVLHPLPADVAQGLVDCAPDYLLTTNYDRSLELCYGNKMQDLPFTATKYLLEPTGRSIDGSLGMFHIHGIAKKPSTICIGYEHYMGYVQHIRSRLVETNGDLESAWRMAYMLLGAWPTSGTWEELFFTSDMAIVGLGMGYEESDLWELLTLRAAVLRTSDTLRYSGIPSSVYTNTISYYDVEQRAHPGPTVVDDHYWNSTNERAEKAQIMQGLLVNVRVVHANSYALGYNEIAQELRSRGALRYGSARS
jgi:hypothetical protein